MTCVRILPLPLASCVMLGELLPISVALGTSNNKVTSLRSSPKDYGICPRVQAYIYPRTEPGKQ